MVNIESNDNPLVVVGGSEPSNKLKGNKASQQKNQLFNDNSFSNTKGMNNDKSTKSTKPAIEMPHLSNNDELTNSAEVEEIIRRILKSLKQSKESEKTNVADSSIVSSGAFAAAMTEIVGRLQNSQFELKIEEINGVRASHQAKLEENQDKMAENANALKEAEKAGIVNQVFGWIATLCLCVAAVFTGGAMGVLMAVSAGLMAVNQVINLEPVTNAMGEELSNKLGKAFLGLEVIVTVALVSMGFGIMMADKMVSSSISGIQKVGQMFSKAAQMTEQTKFYANVTTFAETLVSGAGETTSAAAEVNVIKSESEVRENRADIEDLNNLRKRLSGNIKRIAEQFQQVLEALFKMIAENTNSMAKILNRSVSV